MYSDAGKNLQLDALFGTNPVTPATHVSLHTAYDAAGGNEISGGAPAYARKPISTSAAAAGAKAAANQPEFDVPGGDTLVAFYGLWSALTAGTFLGMFPLGGGAANNPKKFTGESTDDVITSPAHGFSDGDTVVVFSAALPGGLVNGTIYFVRDATTDTFKLAATLGGAAITLSTDGDGVVQRIVTETFGAQGTFTLSAATFSHNLYT